MVVLAQAMGKRVPPLRSKELLDDTIYTEFVDVGDIQHGDIIFLTTGDGDDPRLFHVGVVSIIDEEPHLVHNARHIGFAVTQKLDEAVAHPLYAKVAAVKRPVVESPDGQNLDFLVTYGFEHLAQTE